MQSQLTWIATYEDGKIYEENELNTTELLDRDKLKSFQLFDQEGKMVFVGYFDKNRKMIFRRRTYKTNGVTSGIVYLVGWHSNVKGVSIKSLCYIYDDGHIEFDDARNDIELVPCEMISESSV